MKKYWALARATSTNMLAYRASFFFSLGGVFFQFVSLLAIWRALLDNSAVDDFTWPQMRSYLLVAFASGALVSVFADFGMAYRIQDGTVALDLLKPVGYQEARFAEILGTLWLEVLVVLGVGGAMALIVGGLDGPGGFRTALFVLSMVLLVPLKFTILYACTLACFWTQNFIGVQWARVAIVDLFSGALVPLALLPGWLGTAATWSPFAGVASTPALIFAGRVDGPEALRLVAAQLVWLVLLWFGAKLLWRGAVRQLTVNGG